jgi:hypothetical protein
VHLAGVFGIYREAQLVVGKLRVEVAVALENPLLLPAGHTHPIFHTIHTIKQGGSKNPKSSFLGRGLEYS